jgi:diguanylate cyclase (GGDEF)-like protein
MTTGDVTPDPPESAEHGLVRASRMEALADAQRMVLATRGLSPLVKYLLEDLPGVFEASRAELRMHDPDGSVARVLTIHRLFGDALMLESDSEAIRSLYPSEPVTGYLNFDDERMFSLFRGAEEVHSAIVMPLLDGNRLVGSFHLGFPDNTPAAGAAEMPLFRMLGQLVASSLIQVFEHESTERLTLVDPVTEVGNVRAFRRDMQRELSWARRTEHPLTLLYIGIHDLQELCTTYGEVSCNFLQRRVSQRLCAELRATDYIAHLSMTRFAVLLPSCSEPHAHDIAERMRQAIEHLAIDNGRGAVLYVTLSIGLVSWEPARHPVESDDRLARQLESEAEGAMLTADRAGGNRVTVARLGLLML